MKKSLPKSLDKEDKGPKTDFDQKFLDAVQKAKAVSGIKSDRAMSIELGRHTDFINRVRNGFQSAPADAWDALLSKYPAIADSVSTTNVIAQGGSQAIGTNHGTAIGSLTLDDCQRDLAAAQKEIALLTSQLADKERTIQILLKQIPA